MSQILVSRTKSKFLYSELLFSKQAPHLISNVNETECYVCQKGINDGYSLYARIMVDTVKFFCEKHCLHS